MASIRTNDGPDGMRNDFEQSAAHLLPYDPVAKKHAAGSNKRGSAEVSAVSYEATNVAAFGTKPGIGKSGVHFRYYDKSEYSKLTKEQKTELCEWRSKGGAEWGRGDAKTKKAKFENAVAAAVEKKINKQAKASEEEKMAGEKLRSLVASTVKETGGTTTSGRQATTVGATTATSKPSNPTTQNWGRLMSPEAVLAKPQWNAYGPHPAVMRADRPTWPTQAHLQLHLHSRASSRRPRTTKSLDWDRRWMSHPLKWMGTRHQSRRTRSCGTQEVTHKEQNSLT